MNRSGDLVIGGFENRGSMIVTVKAQLWWLIKKVGRYCLGGSLAAPLSAAVA